METEWMKPEWRTTLVVELCASMRALNEYTYLPPLADALGAAGCDNDYLLYALRQPLDPCVAQRLVAEIYSEETRAAVRAIDDYAADLDAIGEDGYPYPVETPISYEFLMETARRYLETEEEPDDVNSMDFQNYMFEHGEEFWKNYERVTGTRVPDPKAIFFSCAC